MLSVSEIISKTALLESEDEQIDVLRSWATYQTFLNILQFAYDVNVNILLPYGETKYNPSQAYDDQGKLLHEARKLYIFVENGLPNLRQDKREALWIEFLESIHKDDARFMEVAKNRKVEEVYGLKESVVRKAFPDLLPHIVEVKETQPVETKSSDTQTVEEKPVVKPSAKKRAKKTDGQN